VGIVGEKPLFRLPGQALGAPSALSGRLLQTMHRLFEHSAHQGDHSTCFVSTVRRGEELLRKHRGGGKQFAGRSQVIETDGKRRAPERRQSMSRAVLCVHTASLVLNFIRSMLSIDSRVTMVQFLATQVHGEPSAFPEG